MISLVRSDANILDPRGNPNLGEMQNGVHIACATGPTGNSNNKDSITNQLVNQYGVRFTSIDGRQRENIGWIFTRLC